MKTRLPEPNFLAIDPRQLVHFFSHVVAYSGKMVGALGFTRVSTRIHIHLEPVDLGDIKRGVQVRWVHHSAGTCASALFYISDANQTPVTLLCFSGGAAAALGHVGDAVVRSAVRCGGRI